MSLSEQEKQILIELHIQKAEQFMQQADEMCNLCHWDLAINRYYYSIFHALHALYAAKGFSAHTHDGLITIFGKEFVQKEIVDRKYGRYLARMEQLRKMADYNCITSVAEEDVKELSIPSHELLEVIKSLI